MKKLFISQPMNGKPEEEILKERETAKRIAEEIVGEELELIDSYFKENVPDDAGCLWYLGDSIKLLDKADYVYFCDGWYKAKGCKIEMQCCDFYKKEVLVP